jgi:hypothetical protein
MSGDYTIKADTVLFQNEYVKNNITLKHTNKGYALQFGSDIKFQLSANFEKEITIGEYSIQIESDGDLSVSKNDVILLKLNS